MTIAMAVDEDRSGKRKIAKFNFYEEEDNKLRNKTKNDRNINNSKLSKSAKKEDEK